MVTMRRVFMAYGFSASSSGCCMSTSSTTPALSSFSLLYSPSTLEKSFSASFSTPLPPVPSSGFTMTVSLPRRNSSSPAFVAADRSSQSLPI